MSLKTFTTVSRRTQVAAALAAFAALIAGLAIMNGPANKADAAPGESVVLGANTASRIPACPQRCTGVAIVNGLQAKAGGIENAYRVPFVGQITRWKLTLGKPNQMQRNFFATRFGAQPQAAIGVLAKKIQGGKVTYKLRSRTAIQGLNRFLGTTATFTPKQPIRVNKGDYVALIVPTWAPALSVPRACSVVNGEVVNPTVCDTFKANNSWVASRTKAQCEFPNGMPRPINMKTSQPQIKVNSLSPYGCRFNGVLTYRVRVESR